MKNKILIFAALITFFSSCVSMKQSKVPTETNFNSNSTKGLVIGTITFVHR